MYICVQVFAGGGGTWGLVPRFPMLAVASWVALRHGWVCASAPHLRVQSPAPGLPFQPSTQQGEGRLEVGPSVVLCGDRP